jgi:hypothetical protein
MSGKKPKSPLSLGYRPGLSHDSRNDLGYGRVSGKFHVPRASGAQFPYSQNDEYGEDIDAEPDKETLVKIRNKLATPGLSGDFLIGRTADHSSFASGNRPVAIGEGISTGLVPFPGMYKKRMQAGGGVTSPKAITPGSPKRTGTYRGWSHAPSQGNFEQDYLEYDEESAALDKAKRIVRNILKVQNNK